jgi:hypothetical protein
MRLLDIGILHATSAGTKPPTTMLKNTLETTMPEGDNARLGYKMPQKGKDSYFRWGQVQELGYLGHVHWPCIGGRLRPIEKQCTVYGTLPASKVARITFLGLLLNPWR